MLSLATAAFRPQSKDQLQSAVKQCINISPIGDCSDGAHGSIQDWDVSAVTVMSEMFMGASAFDQDLSKWDVSAVTNMGDMFLSASAFNQDLSNWDVSAVTNMGAMFYGALAFNQDLSKWDVSAVTDMRFMFEDAPAFNRELCGDVWVKSKADKEGMFVNSPGSISSTVCTTAIPDSGSGECTPRTQMKFNSFPVNLWWLRV